MNKRLMLIIFLIFVLVRVSIFVFIPRVIIKVNGEDVTTLLYNEEYEEKGALVYCCNVLKCTYLGEASVKREITTDIIGDYYVDYEYNYKDITYKKTRVIHVIDNEKPVVTLNGSDKIFLSLNDKYNELGATASDNYDGDLTDKVVIKNDIGKCKIGSYSVTYSVKDSSSNATSVKREIVVYDETQEEIIDKSNTEVKDALNDIETYIKNKNLSISIVYYDITTGNTYKYNPNKVIYGCSLIKILDAMYVYENMEVTDRLRSLVKKAIEVSDNDAHYSLVNTIGKSKLKKYGESLGVKNVLTTDYYGYTTVDDQLAYMKHLFKLINTLPNGDELRNFFLSKFNKYIDFDGAPDILHKYGKITGVYYHESAIVLDENPYIISILTRDEPRKYVVTELSKKFYELHKLLKEA